MNREKQIIYDLMPHWTFWRDNGQVLRLDQLEACAYREPKITGQVALGDPLRTQPARVLVNLSSDGLALWDVRTHVSHRWAHKAPPRIDLDKFAAALKALRVT